MIKRIKNFVHTIDLSALMTVVAIIILFSGSIIVTLIAPQYVDPTWKTPSSEYQVQMYEISDPNFYLSSAGTAGQQLQYAQHLKRHFSLLAFKESDVLKIQAPEELKKYVTSSDDSVLKLTSRLLLLRPTEQKRVSEKNLVTYELFEPSVDEAFSIATSDGILQDWVDQDFLILDPNPEAKFHHQMGVIYVANPIEFRVLHYQEGDQAYWRYDAAGETIKNLTELTAPPLSFTSRKALIEEGEHIYAIEGCWYCHTDQTRTLVQDLVLNGADSYPAPPSMPNEYIYQNVTFPGTKRNGPDISRVGIKKPSRDWHKSHFWSPKTASIGSIMPAFRHFFDFDPRGTSSLKPGVPNRRFEAIFQYLMTKGTRITPPTEAWWLGKDPIQTKEIIEGKRKNL